jgi:DNA-binding response OmpR family regulator
MTHRRILIVHHERVLQDVLTAMLENPTTEITCASSGGLGAVMMSEKLYDLVLINGFLPDMPSVELAVLAANENIPSLFLSGWGRTNAELARYGFPSIKRPYNWVELHSATDQAIRESQINILKVKASAARFLANLAALEFEVDKTRTSINEILAKLGGRRLH